MPIISPWGTIAYYQVNRTYIARVLCENRDRPQLKCDGQCYLVKKLKAQQDKQDKETTERVQNTPLAQLFCQINPSFLFQPFWVLLPSTRFSVFTLRAYVGPLTPLFHPPQV